ncbi:MAG: DUF4093 domain-containing protein [Ruminococcus sp.]|nr:DUF4093 domain-containing protein [Ruminococcus sp.]
MEKIRLRQAVVCEGKYDRIALSALIDGVIITTEGFGIYSDPDIIKTVRYYAERCGLIIMTDSDSAGQQIRGRIKGIVDSGCEIINVYVPAVKGKEKRKSAPSKEGILGVEGLDRATLTAALAAAGLTGEERPVRERVEKSDLYDLGLSGAPDSSERRRRLCRVLGLPERLSANALRDALSVQFGREDFLSFYTRFSKEETDGKY